MRTHRYTITNRWTGNLGTGTSSYTAYSRDHEVRIGSKPPLLGSSDPAFRGDPSRYNPEELLVSALAQCHMLWFLHLAIDAKLVVDRYVDEAVGMLERTWVSKVTLRPRVTFSGRRPSDAEHRALHHKAHEKCFIANSVKSEVLIEPQIVDEAA